MIINRGDLFVDSNNVLYRSYDDVNTLKENWGFVAELVNSTEEYRMRTLDPKDVKQLITREKNPEYFL